MKRTYTDTKLNSRAPKTINIPMEMEVDINTEDYRLDVLAKFNSFRKERKYCDFIIKTGKKSIPVHRCILAASSEYFDAMLSHDTKESREGVVEIHDADESSILKCIEFTYTGEASVPNDMRGDLLHVAHMLRLHRLYNGIALFLENELDCETFFTTRQIANLYDCSRLVSVCNEFALKNFRTIAKMDEFKKIEAKYLDFLLSADGLKESDCAKCKALMVWINYDSTRASSLFSMMKHIDFMNVPLSYRRFLVDDEAAVSESNECLKLLMKSILDGEKVKASDASLDPGIVVFDHNAMKMRSLNVENGNWTEMQDLHEKMRSSATTVLILDDHLYAFVSDRNNYRIRYKECHAKWEAIAVRSGNWGLAVALNDYIYVTDHDHCANQIERYNPSENSWSFITNTLHVLSYSAMAVTKELLYIFGGRLPNNLGSAQVQMFDPNCSTWSDVGNLRQLRYSASAVTLDDVIYIFGGYNSSGQPASNLEIFRTTSNTAQLVTLPNFSRQNFLSHSLDGIIYLVGGDSAHPLTIDAYDPKTEALTKVITMDGILMNTCESVLALI